MVATAIGVYGRLRIVPMPASRVINPVRGMPFRWSFNPYRGCAHACRYCYARRTHEFLGYNAEDDFDRIILAKLDAPRCLRAELTRPTWRRELVAVGTATDPYQPPEGRLRLTRRSLAVFLAHRTPISLVTKSTLVVRDRDLLGELCRRAPATTVWMTITTLDRTLARSVEPGAPPPAQRLRAVRMLAQAGVRVGVMIAPILPGLTDDPAGLAALVQAAREAGAVDVHASPLRLCEGAREVYLAWLRRRTPWLSALYRDLYRGGDHVDEAMRVRLETTIHRLKQEAGFTSLPASAVDSTADGQTSFGW
ncbi:MAG TPA: radical SAM protein [Limnochordales bacterium]